MWEDVIFKKILLQYIDIKHLSNYQRATIFEKYNVHLFGILFLKFSKI